MELRFNFIAKSLMFSCIYYCTTAFVAEGSHSKAISPEIVNRTLLSELYCIDFYNRRHRSGRMYQPNADPCYKCKCDAGHSISCQSEVCRPPEHCIPQMVDIGNKCCNYQCINIPGTYPNGSRFPINPTLSHDKNNNLGIRLVASSVTSFLILSLLIFLVHRLRNRRLLIMMSGNSHEQPVAYLSEFDTIDFGRDYTDVQFPPSYSPPKPAQPPPGDAPPPYMENLPQGHSPFSSPEQSQPMLPETRIVLRTEALYAINASRL